MEFNFTDLLPIIFIALFSVPITLTNALDANANATITWEQRSSATKRKVILDPDADARSSDEIILHNSSINMAPINKCLTPNGTLDLGQAVFLDNCGELKCVEESNGNLALAEVRCHSQNEPLKTKCKWSHKPNIKFPDCCWAAFICEETKTPSKSQELPSFGNIKHIWKGSFNAVTSVPLDSAKAFYALGNHSHNVKVEEPMLSASSTVEVLSVPHISSSSTNESKVTNNRGNRRFRHRLFLLKKEKDNEPEINLKNNQTEADISLGTSTIGRVRGYDYKKFVERKKQSASEVKPSFFLPVRRRVTLGSNVTTNVAPDVADNVVTIPSNETQNNVTTIEDAKESGYSEARRRRLSSLLSSQSLRGSLGEKLVPIIAATSDLQKAFLFSKDNPELDNQTVVETLPIVGRNRPPGLMHWSLRRQGKSRQFPGTFIKRRKLFSNRLHKLTEVKPQTYNISKDIVPTTGQATSESKDVSQTEQPALGATLSVNEDIVKIVNNTEIPEKLNEEEKQDLTKNEGDSILKVRERVKLRRKELTRKKIPILNLGDVKEKRLLDILSYEPKRQNLTEDSSKNDAEIIATDHVAVATTENPEKQIENVDSKKRRKWNLSKERLLLHIIPRSRNKSRTREDLKTVTKDKANLVEANSINDNKVEPNYKNETKTTVEKASETIPKRPRMFSQISIPVFHLNGSKNRTTSPRGKIVFDLTKASESNDNKVTSRGRRPLVESQTEEQREVENISENDISSTNPSHPPLPQPPEETEEEEEDDYVLVEPPPGYEPANDPDYPKFTPIKSSLEDFDRHYPLPDEGSHRKFYDMDLSSSDADIAKLLGQEENEIHDPNVKIPMTVTTVVISKSEKSYRTSSSRNTAKNFKETPIYESKTYYKNAQKPKLLR